MKISNMIEQLLCDLEGFDPDSPGEIVRFVKSNKNFGGITLLARNHSTSQMYLHDLCLFFMVCVRVNKDPKRADLKICALLSVLCDIEPFWGDNEGKFQKLLSSVSGESNKFYWSRAIATSYLIQQEVTRETICISA